MTAHVITQAKPDDILSIGEDKYLDPYLRSNSDDLDQIINTAIADLLRVESRRRKRTEAEMRTCSDIVAGVICAAANHHLSNGRGWLFTTRANDQLARKSQYKSPLHSKQYPSILDTLAKEPGAWIEQRVGVQTSASNAPATTIRASQRLKVYLEQHGISLGDIRRIPGRQTIILKDRKPHSGKDAKRIEYEDTPKILSWRKELETINSFLEEADIEVFGGDYDEYDRALRRTFNNGRFEHGGRLDGGFWIPMSKKDRFEDLEIQGERIVELDFCQMSLAAAYGLSGAPLPEGDLYHLNELSSYWTPQMRSRVKQYVNAMLYRTGEMKRRPKDIKPIMISHDGIKEREVGAKVIRDLILKKHSCIAEWFECDRGMELMFYESQIIIQTILKLMDQEIVALPIYDAILVSRSKGLIAKEVMMDSFKEITGGEVKVDIQDSVS